MTEEPTSKAKPRSVPTPPRDDLVKLRQSGMKREEIASYYGVSMSRVKRWIKSYGIETATEPMKAHSNAKRRQEKRRSMGEDDGLTIMEKARLILGKRVVEDFHRGYLLDGRPVRLDVLIKAAGLSMPEIY